MKNSKLYNIEQLIYSNLNNDNYTCLKYEYNNDFVINPDLKNYFKIVINIETPEIIFLVLNWQENTIF